MSIVVHNEIVKLRANALNNSSVGVLMLGTVLPIVLKNTVAGERMDLAVMTGAIIAGAIVAAVLHVMAVGVLWRLKE